MDLSERLIWVKSNAEDKKDFPSYMQDDVVFLFEDVIRPVGLVLNHKDSSECYVLFPSAPSMQEIAKLEEDPSWVGASMQMSLHKPSVSMLTIVSKLLHDKALEKGEEYEYIPIQPLDPGDPRVHSTPREKGGPAVPEALPHGLKQMPTQGLEQLLNSLQQEMKNEQDASLGSGPDVSSVLQTLLNEGALRTNIPKLSAFSGAMAKGEVSFDQ